MPKIFQDRNFMKTSGIFPANFLGTSTLPHVKLVRFTSFVIRANILSNSGDELFQASCLFKIEKEICVAMDRKV